MFLNSSERAGMMNFNPCSFLAAALFFAATISPAWALECQSGRYIYKHVKDAADSADATDVPDLTVFKYKNRSTEENKDIGAVEFASQVRPDEVVIKIKVVGTNFYIIDSGNDSANWEVYELLFITEGDEHATKSSIMVTALSLSKDGYRSAYRLAMNARKGGTLPDMIAISDDLDQYVFARLSAAHSSKFIENNDEYMRVIESMLSTSGLWKTSTCE